MMGCMCGVNREDLVTRHSAKRGMRSEFAGVIDQTLDTGRECSPRKELVSERFSFARIFEVKSEQSLTSNSFVSVSARVKTRLAKLSVFESTQKRFTGGSSAASIPVTVAGGRAG